MSRVPALARASDSRATPRTDASRGQRVGRGVALAPELEARRIESASFRRAV
jgi:hypothetical protein